MQDCKVSILGTEYQILFKNREENKFLNDCDGYVDRSIKKIVISNKDNDCEIEDFPSYQKKCLRHEIIHAFMEESGLSVNFEHKPIGIDETMVDWFAIQSPKIFKVFQELDII